MNLLHQRIGGYEGISKLLRHFYADVRQDPLIGPIFNAKDQGLETSLGNHGEA
jgi:truncated hemoglobin YjbI